MSVIPIFDIGLKVLDKFIPDPEQKQKAKLALLKAQQDGDLREIEAKASIIKSEAEGESYLQRNWRPITMLSFVAIVVNNHILYPYLSLFWDAAPLLPVPADLWDLIKIGLGGYVVGRSVEKSIGQWKSK